MQSSTKRLLAGFNYQSLSNLQNIAIAKLNEKKNNELKGDK